MQHAIIDVILDARDLLDTEAYVVFVDWLCALIAREAATFIGWKDRAA